eukprot:m.173150 g.173150  ORF g.173150 m.173150 type:complete len:166 (+) comp16730_c0_seq3:34-531(+)
MKVVALVGTLALALFITAVSTDAWAARSNSSGGLWRSYVTFDGKKDYEPVKRDAFPAKNRDLHWAEMEVTRAFSISSCIITSAAIIFAIRGQTTYGTVSFALGCVFGIISSATFGAMTADINAQIGFNNVIAWSMYLNMAATVLCGVAAFLLRRHAIGSQYESLA